MFKKIIFASLIAMFLVSSILFHTVYGISFNDYESAAFLAKIPEVKIEINLIATHAGNKDAIDYYTHVLNQYWTVNDTKALKERNPELADLISSTINDTIVNAQAGNADKASSDYFDIAGHMEQAGEVRVDPLKSSNSTVQALSIAYVLKESLVRYSDAVNSPIDLNYLSSISTGNMDDTYRLTSGTQKIVNEYAYENSKALAHEALQMFGQFITHTSETKQIYNDKIGNAMTKYISDLNSATDLHTLMIDIKMDIYSNFVAGYGLALQSIPEFPFPPLMVTAMICIVITISRFVFKRKEF